MSIHKFYFSPGLWPLLYVVLADCLLDGRADRLHDGLAVWGGHLLAYLLHLGAAVEAVVGVGVGGGGGGGDVVVAAL